MPECAKKLLIVDDELATRSLLSQIFVQMGYSVRTAKDGFSALAMIRESTPDILLSDLNMPGMSGFELLSVVRQRLPSIYVIATSGAYHGKEVPHGISADAFYEKASGFRLLLGLMATAAEERQPRAQMPRALSPMWVPETTMEPSCRTNAVVQCFDCLRTFPHTWGESKAIGDEVREVGCLYCGTPIYYAIVQPLDPLTSQPYHPKLVASAKPYLVDGETDVAVTRRRQA